MLVSGIRMNDTEGAHGSMKVVPYTSVSTKMTSDMARAQKSTPMKVASLKAIGRKANVMVRASEPMRVDESSRANGARENVFVSLTRIHQPNVSRRKRAHNRNTCLINPLHSRVHQIQTSRWPYKHEPKACSIHTTSKWFTFVVFFV